MICILDYFRYNAYNKLNVNHLNKKEIIEFYKALQEFVKIIEDKKNNIWLSLNQNQIIIFDK